MTRKRKCHSVWNSFVAAAEQVCLQPVLEHRQRRGRCNIAGQSVSLLYLIVMCPPMHSVWRRHVFQLFTANCYTRIHKKGKGSPYSITERRVLELIPVLGSQPAGDVSHKPGGRLPLLSARPAVTPATLKVATTSFSAWWTEARWVWTVCLTHTYMHYVSACICTYVCA